MNDDDNDPLGAAKGLYVAFLITGLFYTVIAILWTLWANWPLW